MTSTSHQPTQNPYQHLITAFPHIHSVRLRQDLLQSPYLPQLGRLLRFNIPLQAYPPQLAQLHEQITAAYYAQLLPSPQPQPQTYHYQQLANYVHQYQPTRHTPVHPQLLQMGNHFLKWPTKEVTPQLPKPRYEPYKSRRADKQQQQVVKMGTKNNKAESSRPQSKAEVQILLGKNISLQCREMREEILVRAKNKQLVTEEELNQSERQGIEINYILNRITQEYFKDFLNQLKPYLQHQHTSQPNQHTAQMLAQKIIEKVMEEHNFSTIYCRLVKALGPICNFKRTMVAALQHNFYEVVRRGHWQGRQEVEKKQLLGLCQFIGLLIRDKFLSKNILKDLFYQLVRSYVTHYHLQSNKNSYYHQTYIECAIRIIQQMGPLYQHFLHNATPDIPHTTHDIPHTNSTIAHTNSTIALATHDTIALATQELLESATHAPDHNFNFKCDYIKVLRIINDTLPSNRYKLSFLLEDFRCSQVLHKQKLSLQNQEQQLVQQILSIDPKDPQANRKIQQIIGQADLQVVMKDFLFQFAESTLAQLNKSLLLFKGMVLCPGVSSAAVCALKSNTQDLFLIECDYPYLTEGLARMCKVICEHDNLDFQQLQLGQDDHQDQDIREFLQKVEAHYFKMIMED